MSSLRNILQRCARNASILGSTPLQIQCTFNPVYSAYPTSISRQAYSSDANEALKNDSVQKYLIEMMNAKKSRSNVGKDQNVSKVYSGIANESSENGMKSQPSVAGDQKASNAPIFNKNLNLRKYYISIFDLSKETTLESLRDFYSQFGEIASCKIIFQGEPKQFGNIAFTSRIAMDRALNSLPHCIDGKEVKNVVPSKLGKRQLTLNVLDLSPKTTSESLRKFYSRFGWLNNCWINQKNIAAVGEVLFANQIEMHRALDAQPHIIDGSEVFLQYATFDLDFEILDIPVFITEAELIDFYSKYGQLRHCQVVKGRTGIPHAFVSYSAINEIKRAMDDRPHIIGGKPLKVQFLGKGHSASVSLSVGSLPENVTEETLREEFSKYGKLVFWKLVNDGQFNQSGPYGIVSYGSEEEAIKVLNSGPHTIEGSVVDVRIANEAKRSSKMSITKSKN